MQNYGIKFGYVTGQKLCFSAYQPNGIGRGVEGQPLPELAKSYYGATPLTDLVAGDEVIAYVLDRVTYGGSPVVVLAPDGIYYEGARVRYGEQWVISNDSSSSQLVTIIGDVVGAQEWEHAANWFDLMDIDINDIIVNQNKVVNIYPIPGTGGGAVASGGGAERIARGFELDLPDIGYFRRKRIEKYG